MEEDEVSRRALGNHRRLMLSVSPNADDNNPGFKGVGINSSRAGNQANHLNKNIMKAINEEEYQSIIRKKNTTAAAEALVSNGVLTK